MISRRSILARAAGLFGAAMAGVGLAARPVAKSANELRADAIDALADEYEAIIESARRYGFQPGFEKAFDDVDRRIAMLLTRDELQPVLYIPLDSVERTMRDHLRSLAASLRSS